MLIIKHSGISSLLDTGLFVCFYLRSEGKLVLYLCWWQLGCRGLWVYKLVLTANSRGSLVGCVYPSIIVNSVECNHMQYI